MWYGDYDKDIWTMPGNKIYHNTIPGILAKVDPGRPYWPSSPFGNNKDPNDQESGDTHQWDIWSNWTDYKEVIKDSSLFVSEFGFQAPANISTWEGALSKDKFHSQNQFFESHNKQTEGQERLFKFLSGHLPVSNEWSEFIYLTQLNQALALKTCIEHWRTNKITNGCLIWQLNDCWPVVSWSIIDSSHFPKMAFYFVKNTFAPTLLLFIKESSGLKVYGLNQGVISIKGLIKNVIIELSSGEALYENSKEVLLKQNSYKPAINIPKKFQKNSDDYIYIVTLYNQRYELIARNFYLDREWKHIGAPIPKINIKRVSSKKKNALMLSTNKPAYFVDLYHPKISFSDRGFFLLPGEEKMLNYSQIGKQKINHKDIKIFMLNNYLEK
jgi:beta-mannosidase